MTRKSTKKRKGAGQRVPTLRVHKQSQRCYGTFSGKVVWFGPRSDPATQQRFDVHLAQWLARGRKPEQPHDEGISVKSIAARYLRHLEEKHGEGWHPKSRDRISQSLKPLLRMHREEPAAEFSPLKLKAVRHAMIASGRLCRSEINARVQIIRRCFRWAVSEELVPATVSHGLQAVDHLRPGEYGVREGKARGPVAEEVVFATLPHLHPVAAAIVELLWWTGARPGEVLNLCPQDIDRSGNVWLSVLRQHKTAKKGKNRELALGPQAQRVLRRYVDRVPPPAADKALFSPRLAMAEHNHLRREGRRTPLYDSHERRYERERARREAAKYGDRYTSSALRLAISRAVTRANQQRRKQDLEPLPTWTPYMLRHAALTRIRKAHGLEAAKAIGGHATALMSEGYTVQAERELARRIAAELG